MTIWTEADAFRAAEIEYPVVSRRAKLTVEISLVTPLYGGGVEAGEVDRNTPFRASSIRGNLRYWWRAARGGTFETWEKMREAESAIWGDTENPSKVKVEVQFPDDWSKGLVRLRKYEHDLNRKYALFPPYNQRGVNLDDSEKGFLETGTFKLSLSVAESRHRIDVEAALWAWVNIGGLGARTRRGAGSLFCQPYAGWNPSYVQGDGKLRPWPTLKGGTVVWGQARKGSTAWADAWLDVLQLYREFRQDRVGRGPTAWPEPNEIRAIRQGRGTPTKEGFPRGALGLPIVFHFKNSSAGEPPDQTLSVDKHFGRAKQPQEGRMTSRIILKPLAVGKDIAHPLLVLLNAPEPGQLYLFQKGPKAEPVAAGRRDAIAELLLRAERKWGGSTALI